MNYATPRTKLQRRGLAVLARCPAACAIMLLCALAGVASAAVPKIDLYTMGRGAGVEEKFGHAALCTRYESHPERDRCYNYGTTNFNDPATLGWTYLRARSLFWVSMARPDAMVEHYIRRDRTVWVQEIPATPRQAVAMARKLRFDSQEANRYYIYHHFFDNCTTRLRDIIDTELGGILSRDSDVGFGATFRDLSRRGFADSPAILVASDYFLGRIGDREPTLYEAMFLPEVLRAEVASRLGAKPVVVFQGSRVHESERPAPVRFYMVLVALLLAIPAWLGLRRETLYKRALIPGVAVLTLIGLLAWAFAVFSPLPMARANEVLLLFVPSDFLILMLRAKLRQRYCQVRVVVVLLAGIAALVGLLKQPLWAVSPLPVLMLLPLALHALDRGRD